MGRFAVGIDPAPRAAAVDGRTAALVLADVSEMSIPPEAELTAAGAGRGSLAAVTTAAVAGPSIACASVETYASSFATSSGELGAGGSARAAPDNGVSASAGVGGSVPSPSRTTGTF